MGSDQVVYVSHNTIDHHSLSEVMLLSQGVHLISFEHHCPRKTGEKRKQKIRIEERVEQIEGRTETEKDKGRKKERRRKLRNEQICFSVQS